MAEKIETPQAPQPPKKRRRLLKAIFWLFGDFHHFARGRVFCWDELRIFERSYPSSSQQIDECGYHHRGCVDHPFKEVVLHNLVVKTTGDKPLVTAPEVHTKYSLMDIIGGKIHIELAELNSPKIVLIQNADGTSNLDPLTKGQKEKPKNPGEKKAEKPGQASKPPEIDIKKFAPELMQPFDKLTT